MESVLRSVALARARKQGRLNGVEIRFLREHERQTPAAFAGSLGTDQATLKSWENDQGAPGPEVDRLIRLLALGLSEGLAGYVPDVARSLGQLSGDSQPLQIEIDPETMQYRYAA